MPWQFWLGLCLGVPVGGLIGYGIGALVNAAGVQKRAISEEDAADRKADAAHSQVEKKLREELHRTDTANEKELKDALNADFADPTGGVQWDDPDKTPVPGQPPGK